MTGIETPLPDLGDFGRLEDVVDREALTEVCRSFHELFGISIRVFSRTGTLLADVHEQHAVCRYVNTMGGGRRACSATVTEVKGVTPGDEEVVHPCFTGAVYRVVAIDYQGQRVGRFVLGPYLPAEQREVPRTLLVIDPAVEPDKARTSLAEMPRVKPETAERLVAHLQSILDLILFSSHRAHLTTQMHVASVRESYRELAEKTAELQSAYDRLKELDRLKSNFLATISHELRTPLTSILGYSEMLGSGIAGPLNEEQTEFVETIRGKGDHLLALISNLLDLNRLEQGRLRVEKQRIHADHLVEEVVTNITPEAQKKGVRVERALDEALPPIDGDPVRLRQVLFNLADNAIKFTPSGGSVRIEARATEMQSGSEDGFGAVLMGTPRGAVEFLIGDTGIGIAAEELDRIFDAFYQVDGSSTRAHGGTGLGLNIVKRLVDAHDGEVRVESEEGRGTTFRVLIPENPADSSTP